MRIHCLGRGCVHEVGDEWGSNWRCPNAGETTVPGRRPQRHAGDPGPRLKVAANPPMREGMNISDADWEKVTGPRDPRIVEMEQRMNRAWTRIDGTDKPVGGLIELDEALAAAAEPCETCAVWGRDCCKLHRPFVSRAGKYWRDPDDAPEKAFGRREP